MRVVVTGASGFLGRTLCPALVAAGHDVVPCSLRDGHDRLPLAGAAAVVHLAALAHTRDAAPSTIREVNIELAEHVGRAAAAAGARMVFLSSVKVHGELSATPLTERSPIAPQDVYGESKARAEDALRGIADLSLTVVRPPLVYGPGVKANFLALMRAIDRGWPLPLASVRNRRSLISAQNLADALTRSLAIPGTFLVCDGPALSTPELCRRIAHALERPVRLFPFPPPLLPRKLAGSLEVDDSSIRSALGWRTALPVDEALRLTAHWYRRADRAR